MTLRLAFVVSLAGFALTAQERSGEAILRQVAQTYKGIKSQTFEATVVLDTKTNSMRMEIPMTGAMVRPGKVRFEMNNPMMSSQTISDGRNTWKYVAKFQQYTRKTASPGVFPMSDGPGDILAGENVLDRLQTAKLLRREKLSVDGNEVDCDVVEAEYSSQPGDPSGQERRKTFWVDRDRSVILKTSFAANFTAPGGAPLDMTESITVTSIRLNQPVAESLFAFVPPDGAKEVDELMPPGMKSAPAPGEK